MDFVSIVLFLTMYYLRPQEWTAALSALHPMYIVMALAIIGLLTRERGMRLREVFRTPYGWMMVAYFGWIIFDSPNRLHAFTDIQGVILFYIVIVLTLTDMERIRRFLGWWTLLIMAVVVLAVASEYGFDFLGSYNLTHSLRMKDRLSLNLSIFRNPNALGHAIAPVIPMLYFMLIWKRGLSKALVFVMALPLWCLYLTQSKGAFLCSFAVILMTLTFGRPKIAQVLILTIAITFGSSLLYMLPRMTAMQKARSDPGIQGRIDAHTFGLKCLHDRFQGVGYREFTGEFFRRGPKRLVQHREPNKPQKKEHYPIASHGAFNQSASELGWPGLALFIGLLYCCMRTLVTAKTANVEEERVRRTLFVMVVAYIVSSWMIDLAYRGMFFMLIATVAAFHRCLMRPELETTKEEQDAFGTLAFPPVPAHGLLAAPAHAMPLPAPALSMALAAHPLPTTPLFIEKEEISAIGNDEEETATPPVLRWKHIGIIDLLLIIALTWGFARLWGYIVAQL